MHLIIKHIIHKLIQFSFFIAKNRNKNICLFISSTLFFGINSIIIYSFIIAAIYLNFKYLPKVNNNLSTMISLIWIMINYLFLSKYIKIKEMIENYKNEYILINKKYNIYFWIYILLSIIAFISEFLIIQN